MFSASRIWHGGDENGTIFWAANAAAWPGPATVGQLTRASDAGNPREEGNCGATGMMGARAGSDETPHQHVDLDGTVRWRYE